MIKLSKKVTFILLVISIFSLMISIKNIDWISLKENNYEELLTPSGCLSISIYFFIYYVNLVKKNNE
jgi:hypothetical protein